YDAEGKVSWPGEYSAPVQLDLSGGGTEFYMTPTVEMFHEGIFQANFDPTAAVLMGLKIQCTNGKTVLGSFEIEYELETITEASTELIDDGVLPSEPVWVDQRAFSDYMRSEGIELFCRDTIRVAADVLALQIPSYSLPSDFAAYTVFDASDNVMSITRANGTTAWIDADNRIDLITHKDGTVFVDYEYDSEGYLIGAELVSARARITGAIEESESQMQRQKVDRMLYLDTVDEVVREEFVEDVTRARSEFARIRRSLESQLYIEVERGFWFWAWIERVEVPGIRAEIEKLNQRERDFNKEISETMGETDDAFLEVKLAVESEFALVLEEYAWQRRKMLLSAARQEAIPVIHFYFWKILGREPSADELSALIKRIDETHQFAGVFEEDVLDKESFIQDLKFRIDTPFYTLLPEDFRDFVAGFTADDDISEEMTDSLLRALDLLISGDDLYADLVEYYGSEESFLATLSDTTKGYIDELETVSSQNVVIRDEYNLKMAELDSIKDDIESFRDLKIELMRLLEDPETIVSYTGYWLENLFNVYDASSLVLENDRLYLRVFDDIAGVFTETELTGFLDSYTAQFSAGGENYSIVMPGDLRSMEMAYAEFIDVVSEYSSGVEELLSRETIAGEWINRGIIQDHFGSDIVFKEKNPEEFSAENLKNELMAREEYSSLMTFKDSVISGVSVFLNEYLADEAGRIALLSGIGLTLEDVIDLRTSYPDNIEEWLENQNIHFGKSAFGALRKYIEERTGVAPDLTELSVKAILIDVLAGNIGPFAGPDLEISMYAMNRTAELYDAASQTKRYTWEDLEAYDGTVITLINLHHYVTVLSVTENEVTYYEQNIGEEGDLVTLSKEEFLDAWQGNVITDEVSDAGTIIQESESRKIKGAFIFAIIGALIGFLMSSILAVVAVAVQVITAIMAGIAVILEGIMIAMAHVLTGLGQLFTFVGQAFFGGLSSLGAAFEGFITGAELATLVSPGVQTFIKIGVSYGISAGLDMMGVDPVISSMISSIVTGGVNGFFAGNLLKGVFQSALQ
ncbi:MAG: hypothetical protein KAG97_08530, partial [Victivallales bacterium]|nr:hypothetical protein [Victivallales bacterium]